MPRLCTPFYVDYPDDDIVTEWGPGKLTQWRLDLSSNAGRKALDVVIANRFRVTAWRIRGSIAGAIDTHTLDETQTAAPPVSAGFGDEREFAVRDALPPDPPPTTQQTMVMGAAASWGANCKVAFSLVLTRENGVDIAYVGTGFAGVTPGPDFVSFNSVQLSASYTQNGSVTFRVPAWPTATTQHSLTTPLYGTSGTGGNFFCDAVASLAYANSDGNPVWNTATAGMITNPIYASVLS